MRGRRGSPRPPHARATRAASRRVPAAVSARGGRPAATPASIAATSAGNRRAAPATRGGERMSEREVFYSVDRLERAVAVLVGDDGVGLDVLKKTLPVKVREGVVLRVRLDAADKIGRAHV